MFRSILIAAATLASMAWLDALALPARAETGDVSAERIREHVRRLASDEFAGRSPGSAGEKLTLDYLQREFASYGFAPGNADGTFLQRVPLVGITATNAPDLVVRNTASGETSRYAYGKDFACWTTRQAPRASVDDADLVFVGYGVVAPEYGWDDYKDVDVAGKYIVMLVGDPPSEDESHFGGKAMTYYGRWTYKFEVAARKGAAGAVVVHHTQDAGYPWSVVENSWTGEQFTIVREDQAADRCAIESWVTEDVARELLAASGSTLEEARAAAAQRDFRPFALGLTASALVENEIRAFSSHNVVARLEGADPARAGECVVYCAHWDHLGVGVPAGADSIYNGALDNASGVAGMLEVARVLGERRDELARSVVFLIPTAEESGLLGATYYADHPAVPLDKTVAMINVDGLNVWGRTRDMVVVGHGQSDLDRLLQEVLAPANRRVTPDAEPEKGFYYRSDHFAFAKKGVPALYSDSGVDVIGKPEGYGMEQRRAYNRDFYHTPLDEYDPSWDLSGAVEDMRALLEVGMRLLTSEAWPAWSETSEFRRIREESLRPAQP